MENLKPSEVIEALAPLYGGDLERVHDTIPRLIREGELKISAKMWKSKGLPNQKTWDQGAPEGVKRKKVKRSKFIGSKNWAEDAKNWKWKSANFYLTRPSGKTLLMSHVRFNPESLQKFIEKFKESKKGMNRPGIAGGPNS